MSNLSLQLLKKGDPLDEGVMQLVDAGKPSPKAGEVLVKMLFAAINPADYLCATGEYADFWDLNPSMPHTLGMEGCATVESVGEGVTEFQPGQKVTVLIYGATWAQYAVCPKEMVIPVPPDMPSEKAAQLRVNPLTAAGMLQTLAVKEGDILVQNGANSACGQLVIALAKQKGVKTINIVRRADAAPKLKELGADHVIASNDVKELGQEIRKLTDGKGANHFIDAVGGPTAADVIMNGMAPHATTLLYGLLSGQNTPLDNGRLIFNRHTIKPFHMATFARQNPQDVPAAMQSLIEGIMSGALKMPVQKTFGLKEWKEAMREQGHNTATRTGKLLFDMTK